MRCDGDEPAERLSEGGNCFELGEEQEQHCACSVISLEVFCSYHNKHSIEVRSDIPLVCPYFESTIDEYSYIGFGIQAFTVDQERICGQLECARTHPQKMAFKLKANPCILMMS